MGVVVGGRGPDGRFKISFEPEPAAPEPPDVACAICGGLVPYWYALDDGLTLCDTCARAYQPRGSVFSWGPPSLSWRDSVIIGDVGTMANALASEAKARR